MSTENSIISLQNKIEALEARRQELFKMKESIDKELQEHYKELEILRNNVGELELAQPMSNEDEIKFHLEEEEGIMWNVQRIRDAIAALEAAAARWRYIRRKLCLTGNGDGTCAMQAINLPANIQGWPEPGQVAEFCDAAIDAAMSKENSND